MATGDIGTVVDTYEFDDYQAEHPDVVHVAGDVFAIPYNWTPANANIRSVHITPAGEITNIQLRTFDTGYVVGVKIARMAPNIFAMAYEGVDSDGWLKTIGIADDGIMTPSPFYLDSFEFDTLRATSVNVVNVTDSVLAIAYSGYDIQGKLRTLGVDAAGNITSVDTAIFDAVLGQDPHIIHVAGEIFAIVSYHGGNQGWIRTVSITTAGIITSVAVDTLVFASILINSPRVVHVIGEVYAIVCYDTLDDGWIFTVSITNAGQIGDSTLDSFEFDGITGFHPYPIALGEGVIAIAYESGDQKGRVKTFAISEAGEITETPIGDYIFEPVNSGRNRIIRVAGNMHAIAYTGPDGDGFIKTLPIERAPVGPGHLLMMGIG